MSIVEKKPEVISVFALFLALFQARPDYLALIFVFWLGLGRFLVIYKHPHYAQVERVFIIWSIVCK